MKKPSYFKNTIVYFILALLSIIFASIILLSIPFQQLSGITLLICAVFCGVYLRMLLGEKAILKKYTFIDAKDYGIMVSFGGYKGTTSEEILKLFESTVKAWGNVLSEEKVRAYLKKDKLFWFEFQEMPIKLPGSTRSVSGYTYYNTLVMHIGFSDGVKLESTAFEHELGHVLQGGVTGVWDEALHHKIAADNHVK